jgi:hypothetical protein
MSHTQNVVIPNQPKQVKVQVMRNSPIDVNEQGLRFEKTLQRLKELQKNFERLHQEIKKHNQETKNVELTQVARTLMFELLQVVTKRLIHLVSPTGQFTTSRGKTYRINYIIFKNSKVHAVPIESTPKDTDGLIFNYNIRAAKRQLQDIMTAAEYDNIASTLSCERDYVAHTAKTEFQTFTEYNRLMDVACKTSCHEYFKFGRKLLQLALKLYPNASHLKDIMPSVFS